MTLLELIRTTPLADILRECERLDENNGAPAYESVLEQLNTLTPRPADFTIVVSPWEQGEGLFHDISGIHPGDDQRYAIELTTWEEWLGAEVRVSNLDLTPAQIVAQCLYEMTFYGFNQERIQDFADGLIQQVADIKSEHDMDDES